jgi:hypothetical protein
MRRDNALAHFRWSGIWVLGPLGCAAILAVLWVWTLADMKQKEGEADQEPSVKEAGPSSEAPRLPEEPGESTSLEEDRRTLFSKLDLGAIPAAQRLWAAGRREDVFIAVEDPLASPNLRLQLLGLLATDGSERAKAAARKVLEMKAPTDEMRALCGLILERGGGEKAHGK